MNSLKEDRYLLKDMNKIKNKFNYSLTRILFRTIMIDFNNMF